VDLTGRHPDTVSLARHFEWGHLPPHLQAVSKPCGQLAAQMIGALLDGPELTFGLQQLLIAKDAFVRAALDVAPGPASVGGPGFTSS